MQLRPIRRTTRRIDASTAVRSGYVDATIEIAAVRPKVRPPPRLPDVWTAIKDHLSLGFADLEPMYSQIPFEILPPQPSKTALAEAFAPDNP
jgi:hypothetical protein